MRCCSGYLSCAIELTVRAKRNRQRRFPETNGEIDHTSPTFRLSSRRNENPKCPQRPQQVRPSGQSVCPYQTAISTSLSTFSLPKIKRSLQKFGHTSSRSSTSTGPMTRLRGSPAIARLARPRHLVDRRARWSIGRRISQHVRACRRLPNALPFGCHGFVVRRCRYRYP